MQPGDPGRWCEEHGRRECVHDRSRGRGQCHGPAVRGADGCRLHLGKQAGPVIAEAVQLEAARRAVAVYGLPRDIDPSDALLEEVRFAAGHVAWLRERVAGLEERELVWGRTEKVRKGATEFKGTDVTFGAAPSVWVDLYMRERKHLVDVCKAAISAGIEERRVKLAEQQGQLLNGVIRRILARLDLSAAQSALLPVVVPEELRRAAVMAAAN
jgi:hypothetical protein